MLKWDEGAPPLSFGIYKPFWGKKNSVEWLYGYYTIYSISEIHLYSEVLQLEQCREVRSVFSSYPNHNMRIFIFYRACHMDSHLSVILYPRYLDLACKSWPNVAVVATSRFWVHCSLSQDFWKTGLVLSHCVSHLPALMTLPAWSDVFLSFRSAFWLDWGITQGKSSFDNIVTFIYTTQKNIGILFYFLWKTSNVLRLCLLNLLCFCLFSD